MKTNEAPEKIYLNKHPFTGDILLRNKWDDSDIEYTRTDAFIEKAEKYLTEKFIKDVSVFAAGIVSINFDGAINNFVKYMKGE